ncbi:MAG: hypothetical protein QNJ22_08465 [Desulfosarcinaceae bacterium]|nr:hypothetical protein [Desulfosarcinaceae bacterium]
MHELTEARQGRIAIRNFQTISDGLTLRGSYRLNGSSGLNLELALATLSPEIYGKMNDPRRIELKGIEYVMDRLPRGIESSSRLVLTTQEGLDDTAFEKIVPLKRRRISYRVSEEEICFIITQGLSEIYDILTHLTFLNIEAKKIHKQMRNLDGALSPEWQRLAETVAREKSLGADALDRALWDLSILLGITYRETRDTYRYFEQSRNEQNANNGLFQIIYQLGLRVDAERRGDAEGRVYFTPALRDIIGHQVYAETWARSVIGRLDSLGLLDRPLHIISANLHSFKNTLYAYGALDAAGRSAYEKDFYALFEAASNGLEGLDAYAVEHGFEAIEDTSGAQINSQVIDTGALGEVPLHPELDGIAPARSAPAPVLLVINYAFGTQAFEVMDELLEQLGQREPQRRGRVASISIMGKAGILSGVKGDLMLATAHVIEGSAHNYICQNDLSETDFDPGIRVFKGPMVTVLGTSLQNRAVLKRFQTTSWRAVGLEMEGGHYHRAISAAMLRGHIPQSVKVRYAYYASDNPLVSGQTLSSGSMGLEGIKPTYMITKVILQKIFNQHDGG